MGCSNHWATGDSMVTEGWNVGLNDLLYGQPLLQFIITCNSVDTFRVKPYQIFVFFFMGNLLYCIYG